MPEATKAELADEPFGRGSFRGLTKRHEIHFRDLNRRKQQIAAKYACSLI
jgi:hypothetical protein